MSQFDYYKLQFKLTNPMLGTATETSIYYEHVLEKAKKEIKKANNLGKAVTKALSKFQGPEITEDKTVKELKGVVAAFCQLVGRPLTLPDSVPELLDLATELEEDFNAQLKTGDQVKATVFLKNQEGKPIISTHMVLGNLKENLKIVVNSGNKDTISSKVAVGETMALDVKFVEDFMEASNDIMKAESQTECDEKWGFTSKGKNTVDPKGRVLLERPISFDRMGKRETAIAMSEQLPTGTTFWCTMRVRKGSKLNENALREFLDLGKSNGLGSWRGSGNMGSYVFKLEPLPEFKEPIEDGWS